MRREVGLIVIGALLAVALLGASTALVLRDDGIQFPDGSVQTSAVVDTTCDGQPCDGTYFTNVTAAAGPGLRVVDSLGQTVGPVVGAGTVDSDARLGFYVKLVVGPTAQSLMLAISHVNRLRIPRRQQGPLFDEVYFSGPSCTGDAYIKPINDSISGHTALLGYSYAFGSNSVIYGSAQDDDPVTFTPASEWSSTSWGPGLVADGCDTNVQEIENLFPAVPLGDLESFGFVGPFKVE